MSGFDDVAQAFLAHYYATLGSTPAGLAGLYQPTSTLTFEGQQFTGPEAIINKIGVSCIPLRSQLDHNFFLHNSPLLSQYSILNPVCRGNATQHPPANKRRATVPRRWVHAYLCHRATHDYRANKCTVVLSSFPPCCNRSRTVLHLQ